MLFGLSHAPSIRCAQRSAAIATIGLLFIGCGSKKAPPQAPRAPEVGVYTLQAESVSLTAELAARTVAYEESDVRPQINGIVRRRLFTEGSLVKAGDVLYEIESQVYAAAVAQAKANLASAEASQIAAKARAERFTALVDIDAVSKQDQTDAVAAAAQAEAAVQQARAALAAAQINLGFTRITAPISGRIGRSLVTTGALVTAGQAQPLASIQRLDPMFVDIQQSSTRLLELRRALSTGGVTPSSAKVTLKLEDGTPYSHPGTLQFAEASVDPNTGSVTLRARFPNQEGILLPGMYVRATVGDGKAPNAILAPQQGVLRDPTGNATAYVLAADSTVEVRQLTLTRTVGDRWLIASGLNDGDHLIIEGTAKIRAGQKVVPVPALPGAPKIGASDSTAAVATTTATTTASTNNTSKSDSATSPKR